jgi:hypothetical protein
MGKQVSSYSSWLQLNRIIRNNELF